MDPEWLRLFPPSWRYLQRVLRYIRDLPVGPWERKQLLMDWLERAGIKMQGWMIEFITGLPPGSF